MKFKNFYDFRKTINFEFINKSFFENAKDYALHTKNKKGLNENLLKSDEQLESEGFFKKYPHLL